MTKSVKLLATALVPAVVAGTCLATPALAANFSFLGGSSVADPEPVEAPVEAPVDVEPIEQVIEVSGDLSTDEGEPGIEFDIAEDGTFTFGGVTFEVPANWTVEFQGENEGVILNNASGSVAVGVYTFEGMSVADMTDDEAKELFDYIATASVESYPVSDVTELGSGDLGNGLYGFGYGITAESDGLNLVMVQIYVPMGDGFTFIQMGYEAENATQDEIDELGIILDTLAPASDEAPAQDGMTCAGGISFALPEGLEDMEDDTWGTFEDGQLIMVSVMGDVAEGAVDLTDQDIADLLDMLAEEFDGTCTGTGTIPANGVTVYGADYAADMDGEEVYITLGMVQLPDGTWTCLLAMADGPTASAYSDAMIQMFMSVTPAMG